MLNLIMLKMTSEFWGSMHFGFATEVSLLAIIIDCNILLKHKATCTFFSLETYSPHFDHLVLTFMCVRTIIL